MLPNIYRSSHVATFNTNTDYTICIRSDRAPEYTTKQAEAYMRIKIASAQLIAAKFPPEEYLSNYCIIFFISNITSHHQFHIAVKAALLSQSRHAENNICDGQDHKPAGRSESRHNSLSTISCTGTCKLPGCNGGAETKAVLKSVVQDHFESG